MKTYEEEIRKLAEPVVESEGMELIHVECLRMKSRWIVRLYMDKPGGVTIDDCASVSDQVGDILNVHDIPPGPYSIEVSSPGLDRPLSRDKDLLRFRGSRVQVRLVEKFEGKRNFVGILEDYLVDSPEKFLVIKESGQVYQIPKTMVATARLVPDVT
ncbi:MAG: ribosome maturation factor RimP [Syntrophales bacterium]